MCLEAAIQDWLDGLTHKSLSDYVSNCVEPGYVLVNNLLLDLTIIWVTTSTQSGPAQAGPHIRTSAF